MDTKKEHLINTIESTLINFEDEETKRKTKLQKILTSNQKLFNDNKKLRKLIIDCQTKVDELGLES